jgi:UTP--glucose-1-phosphate uridylyltransferase
VLAQREAMYAYNFEGRRYDVGDKQGFLQATVEFALRRDDLREEFLQYLIKFLEKKRKVLLKRNSVKRFNILENVFQHTI